MNFYTMHSCLYFESFPPSLLTGHLSTGGNQNKALGRTLLCLSHYNRPLKPALSKTAALLSFQPTSHEQGPQRCSLSILTLLSSSLYLHGKISPPCMSYQFLNITFGSQEM